LLCNDKAGATLVAKHWRLTFCFGTTKSGRAATWFAHYDQKVTKVGRQVIACPIGAALPPMMMMMMMIVRELVMR